jgi:phosphoribosylformylglycinamidine cyclo-ligase
VGAVSQADLESTLNCGVGMVALLPADDVDRAIATLDRFGVHAWAAGEVGLDRVRGGDVHLTGHFAGWGV